MPSATPFPVDLDLRVVRYFVAVAGHGHFGRAAEECLVGQPTLSRQIRGLERRLGVALFRRTPRGAVLTCAGAAFLPHAERLLRVADGAVAAARAAGGPERLVVGYAPGLSVTGAIRSVRERAPGVAVRSVHLGWNDAATALRERRVDAVVARMPLRAERLRVTRLYEEPRMVVLPRWHRLAGRESLALADIRDERLPTTTGSTPECAAHWRLEPRPGGGSAPEGPELESPDDVWDCVAAGEALAVVARDHGRVVPPELTVLPLREEPTTVVVAARQDDERGLVAAFERAAARPLPR
ncbi:Chromosome initiation inhibitor [Actinosynnema pretiosum subsp. pretiosum]|nr:Chromosome initiation inhibitor [Actinosynnema pretiosum subsp. pretiosum]